MEYLANRDAKVLDVSSPEEENEDEQRDTLPEDLDVTFTSWTISSRQ